MIINKEEIVQKAKEEELKNKIKFKTRELGTLKKGPDTVRRKKKIEESSSLSSHRNQSESYLSDQDQYEEFKEFKKKKRHNSVKFLIKKV